MPGLAQRIEENALNTLIPPDPARKACRHMGRDFRLNDVGGNVIHKALKSG